MFQEEIRNYKAKCKLMGIKPLEIVEYDDGEVWAYVEGVDTIDYSLCENCYELKSIKLPESLKIIKQRAFYDCSMVKSIVIPKNVENIQQEAFMGCHKLKDILIETKSLSMQKFAFEENSETLKIKAPKELAEDMIWFKNVELY